MRCDQHDQHLVNLANLPQSCHVASHDCFESINGCSKLRCEYVTDEQMVTFPFSGPGAKWRRKKTNRPYCSSSTNRVANLRPPQPDKKKSVWLWVTATQHLDCALHICGISKLLAEYALDLAQHEFWIKYDLQRKNIAMGSQWTWLQLSLFSVGFGSFPVSQKRPVESWTEGLAVLVKLCKACAGAGTGGVWMQSSAKCRN